MAGYNREKMREQLLKRTQEEYTGGNSTRFFRADRDIPFFAPKPTKDVPYIIDIIPYTASKNYPQLDKRLPIPEGDPVYRLEILIHQNIGPKKEMIVCPTANYGLPCPVCEAIDIMSSEGKEYDDYKSIALKRRCAYNVLVYDGKNDDTIQIWEVSYKYSEKPIRLQAKSPRTGGIEPFSDPDVGKSISFEVANDEYKTIQGHKLIARDYIIPDEILAKAYTLEDEIIIRTYDEIKKIFHPEVSDSGDGINKFTYVQKSEDRQENKSVDSSNCPANGKFGEDIDKLEPCGKCKAYDKCAAEADKIALKLKAERDAKRAASETGSEASGRRLRRPE